MMTSRSNNGACLGIGRGSRPCFHDNLKLEPLINLLLVAWRILVSAVMESFYSLRAGRLRVVRRYLYALHEGSAQSRIRGGGRHGPTNITRWPTQNVCWPTHAIFPPVHLTTPNICAITELRTVSKVISHVHWSVASLPIFHFQLHDSLWFEQRESVAGIWRHRCSPHACKFHTMLCWWRRRSLDFFQKSFPPQLVQHGTLHSLDLKIM
jgi:hypothetical protein